MNLVEVDCYNCGSKEYKYYDNENGYNLVKCSKCGLLYVNPRPSQEDISNALATAVHLGATTINFTGVYEQSKVNKYLRILSEFYPKNSNDLSNKRWLDIGCGYGELLEALRIYTDDKIISKGSDPNISQSTFCQNKESRC